MYTIYFVELSDEIDDLIFSFYLSLISPYKQKRINNLKTSIDKKLTLYAEILVRALACILYGFNNKELIFTINEYGKPLIQGFSRFQFNISHTRNAIAVAISDTPVGIDIERISEANLNISKRFFTESEKVYICKSNVDQNGRFYEIWTQKEAFIKHIGKGLSIPLNSFDVTKDDIQKSIYCFRKNGYVISICNEKNIYGQHIEIKELTEIEIAELVHKYISI